MSERVLKDARFGSQSIRGWEFCLIAGLGLFFLLLYGFLAQVNPTFDSAAFLTYYSHSPYPSHPFHLVFGHVLFSFIAAGRAIGASPIASGNFQAAFFTAMAVVLFYILLRRYGIGPVPSFIYAALLGLNETALENATSVELYASSIFAVLLSFHAYRSIETSESRFHWFGLWLCCVLTLALHLGFAPWVLAVYLTLAWRATGGRAKAALVQGGLTLVPILVGYILAGHWNAERTAESESFFQQYGRIGPGLQVLARLWESPLLGFASYGGLILFPGIYYASGLIQGDTKPGLTDLRRLALLSSLLFWCIYSFWTEDHGSFFYPLLPLWGVISALTLERRRRSKEPISLLLLVLGCFVYFFLFVFLPMTELAKQSEAMRWTLVSAFCVSLPLGNVIASGILRKGWLLRWEGGSELRPRAVAGSFAVSVLVLSLAGYLPRGLSLTEPDDITLGLEAFHEQTPRQSRLVTHIPPFRPSVQSGHETLSAFEGWNDGWKMAANRKTLSGWLREMGRSDGPPLYIDPRIYKQRDFIWGGRSLGNWVDVPLEKLTFPPVTLRGKRGGACIYYEVRYANPEEAGIYSGNLDLYPAENWSGTPVQWTRQRARVPLRAQGSRLKVKFWVGHPDLSEANPVIVRLWIGESPAATGAYSASGLVTHSLELETPMGELRELNLEVSRTWRAPDGREVGVGLYPLEFE